jgi:hypothetical protein
MPTFVFPFGAPVSACRPSADGPRRVFVLGAYPSALHVAWTLPRVRSPVAPRDARRRRIAALAVDNEPEPFWTGADQAERIERWKAAIGFDDAWGTIAPCGSLNGPSGAWVETKILAPLGARRPDAWITDCLDTYRASVGGAARILDTYAPFAEQNGLPAANVEPHPGESDIVKAALVHHRERLLHEQEVAQPEIVVTLGNAALRVLRELAVVEAKDDPGKALRPDAATYGRPRPVRLGSRTAEWVPLAHPAAPAAYQQAHAGWVEEREAGVRRG